MFDIISIGSATRDVLIQSSQFKLEKNSNSATGEYECLPLGSKIEVDKIAFTTGGGATNAGVTFARQGLNTAFVGIVADDIGGNEILKELNGENINTRFAVKKNGQTAYSVILVHEGGERTILSYKGVSNLFEASDVPFEKFETKWIFTNTLGGNYELLNDMVSWAKQNGIKIATNPGGKELAHESEKLSSLLKDFDIVIMNSEEASGLVGLPIDQESQIVSKLNELIAGIVVMTKGPGGVVVSDKKNIFSAGVPDSPVVERTGAGDAFSSGFIIEYIKTGSIEKAIQFATANASSVVTQFGAKAGILKKDDWGPWPLVDVSTRSVS